MNVVPRHQALRATRDLALNTHKCFCNCSALFPCYPSVFLARTHQELLVRVSDDTIAEPRDNESFLAMPIVRGPSEAFFDPHKPAKLRFFAGYSQDIEQEIKDEGKVSHTHLRHLVMF